MAMNRQTKRLLQRQGELAADGTPGGGGGRRPPAPPRPGPRPGAERPSVPEFFREVRVELKRVAWPTRAEVLNYSTIVLVTLAVLIALIFGLDYLFAKAVLFLFDA